VRTVLAGAGIAAVAGLLMGAAAKPQLNLDDRPEGPQILAGWTGVRSTGPFDDGAAFASYNGATPDYVLGTDWKTSLAQPPLQPEAAPQLARNDESSPPEDLGFTHAGYEASAPAAPLYPSLQGGAAPVADEAETDGGVPG
jgi:hypothetical protein